MESQRKNKFKKINHHLKSKQIDEKLELLSEIPTNNISNYFVIEPDYYVQDPDVSGEVTREANFAQDALANGRDTTGLFDDNGTILTIEPPGDTSYILGPMASMWYAWGNFSTIGYIRQADRRMVDLGRITGELSSWNGVNNFTSYGQLTLEQANWFRTTPKYENYRAFYPGPPSNTPDQYGRYYCTITGTSKPDSYTPPERRVPPVLGGPDPNLPPGSAKPKKKGEEEIADTSKIREYDLKYLEKMMKYGQFQTPGKSDGDIPYSEFERIFGKPGLSQTDQDNKLANAQLDPQERKELKMLLKFYKGGGGGSGSDIDRQIRNLEIKLYGIPISASYKPQGELISESRQKILRDLKKPVVLPEEKNEKIKYRPRVIGAPPKTINSDLMKKAEVPSSYIKPEERLWGKYEKNQNARLSQERKNEVLDHLGGSNHAWEWLTETSRQKNQDIMYGHFGGDKKKVIRKEEIKGDTLLFIVDENGKKENILQSELSIKLADEFNKELFEKYFQEQETLQADKDPLFRRVSKKLKIEIDYPDKPSKAGYPDVPPPEMINGWHPEYGQDKMYYNKLDPHSAESMPPTGDPQIDAKVSKAKRIKKIVKGT